MTATAAYQNIARLLVLLITGTVLVLTAVAVMSAAGHHSSGVKTVAMMHPRPGCRNC